MSGWTQTRLSEAWGVPQGAISRFDSNGRLEDWQVVAIMRASGWKYVDLFEIIEIKGND
ncbi:XRE family transcriptional regulator [Bacillus altitudinis]|nr:XRE family transcriptional regulator [Bacillus altitudinis]TYS28349.1 XRE family transcriptional regulator [Bacillus altitudinis]